MAVTGAGWPGAPRPTATQPPSWPGTGPACRAETACRFGDITALDWAAVPPVDLVTAGWPCQDISYAGPGAGIMEPAVASGSLSPPAFATYDPLMFLGERRRAPHAGARESPRRPGCARVRRAVGLPSRCRRRSSAPPRPAPAPRRPARCSRTARGCCRPRPRGTAATGRTSGPGRAAGIGRGSPAVTATGPAPRRRPRSPCCPPRWPATSARTGHPARSGPRGQTAGRPARRDPPPRRPGMRGQGSGTRRGPTAADPRHLLLAERPRPARRPARQRAPERPGPRRRGDRPHAVGPGRHEPGRVGGVRAGDPPLGEPPRVPRPAARRAGAVRPARLSAAFAEWMMGISIRVKCPNSAFLQFRACSMGPLRLRYVSRTCSGDSLQQSLTSVGFFIGRVRIDQVVASDGDGGWLAELASARNRRQSADGNEVDADARDGDAGRPELGVVVAG
jgi:hypothetical protein